MCEVPAGLTTPPPIGKAVPNTKVYVLDQQLRPVPIGVFGEMYLGGVQLARGYFKRDELTRERFIPNPFVPGERMYKTGDLVRWMRDGSVQFFGRIDTQVKIRGFRIELGGIESALYEREDVKEVCVIAREDTPGDKRLVAYIVVTKGMSKPTNKDLRDDLSARVPKFMVPSAFLILDNMPLTPNDKIDRRALPKPDFSIVDAENFVAPSNSIEKK